MQGRSFWSPAIIQGEALEAAYSLSVLTSASYRGHSGPAGQLSVRQSHHSLQAGATAARPAAALRSLRVCIRRCRGAGHRRYRWLPDSLVHGGAARGSAHRTTCDINAGVRTAESARPFRNRLGFWCLDNLASLMACSHIWCTSCCSA